MSLFDSDSLDSHEATNSKSGEESNFIGNLGSGIKKSKRELRKRSLTTPISRALNSDRKITNRKDSLREINQPLNLEEFENNAKEKGNCAC